MGDWEQHEECLLSLIGNKDYSEHNIQVILAAHLFGPLAGGYEIGCEGFPKEARKCPKCGKDISDKLKNTSLGNGDVWHGNADILVNGSVVKIGAEDDNGSGEPVRKKMRRTESLRDDETENTFSDESHVSDSVVETIGCHATSQVLAQTIVNAFTEVNKERKLANSFIPSFIATSEVIRITMYNCGLDSLIMSADLDIFKYDRDKTTLNVSTILNVWYALNFNNYFDERNELFPKFEILYKKSNFKELTDKVYKIYNEKCTKPMTETERNKIIRFEISLESYASPISSLIDETRTLLKNVIHASP
ncbi:uncharacterized protein LOC132742418 [Ruditapes philippinarum]|uniref:uncharacterized protein LOC132742418 n=1 Tax=Ruditapes philippinarum TaxID=129788 RepID=UPI00295B17F8|nr:uncharacterized protein LOC132742418 [Ruditapes philippinarum]